MAPLRGRLALVAYRRLDVPTTDAGQGLQSRFSLTRSEAAVALAIAEGLSIATIAEQRGVTPGTVKAQVKSIAAKTDCRTQGEIAATVNRLGLARG